MTPGIQLRRTRAWLKDAAISLLYRSGLLWGLAFARLRGRAVVLTYHRVLPQSRQAASFSAPGIIVTPETFDRQMRFLRRFFRPLTLDQFVAALQSGRPMPSRSCLVTFDDGWYDTIELALPILRRHGIPAVLFVATEYIGTGRCFWQEQVSRLLFELRDRPEAQRMVASLNLPSRLPSSNLADRGSVRDLVNRLKSFPPEVVKSLLDGLEKLNAGPREAGEDRFLDWNDVALLVSSGHVDIGSHAMTHRPLTKIPLGDAKRELAESRELLRRCLSTEALAIAYPNGDADAVIAEAAREIGFSAGFTTVPGRVGAGAHPLLLCRVNIHEGSTRTRGGFLARIVGLI